ncbi:hypothetical protein HA402_014728 [Bradysia odoriphaga]|nr:hypothetical protein HA402_014728 [Bradysia odoriphaga]
MDDHSNSMFTFNCTTEHRFETNRSKSGGPTDLSAKDGIGSKMVQTNGEGVANVKLTFPEGKVTVYVMAKYKDHAEGLGHFSSSIYHARGGDSIPEFDIKTNDTNISVGDTVKIELVSRTPLKHFTYQVIARGNILISNSQTVQAGAKVGFDFTATFDMVPNVQVVVYTIRDDGNVNTASRRIYLQKKLPNQITLESAMNETEPGTEYDLKITTAPNSYVGLLAVDQSVLLLRSGNDLSVDDVTDDLDQYNNVVSNRRHHYHRRYYWSQTISTIENAGMFVLSNVNDFIPKPIEDVVYHTTTAGYHTKRISVLQDGAVAPQFLAQSSPIESGQSSVTVRKDFPETWIWDGLQVDSGEQHFKKRVPDTITSWVISAFSVSTDNGLGLTKEPTKVTTFKSFFVSVSLPYSVKRGEILSIPVTIFNYLDKTVNADVTFFNDDNEFEFVDLNDEANEIVNADQRRQRKLSIKSNDANGLFFSIRPLKVGQLTIKVIVESALAGDGIQKILLVTPEGVPQYVNKALMLNLPNADGSTVDHDFTIDLPEHTVPNSTFIEISLVGDILGSTVKNLNRLIYMPSGCGEQNMLKFVPNIIVRNYLTAIGQLSEDLEEKTRRNLEIGYQRQLSFRHSNGSFSAFGQQDRRGSTWLTAFVARSFQQASKHINIEPRIINETLNFLNKTQSANGSFPEYGEVIHRRMQGGADGNVALTAYTLIAFLENREAFPYYEDNIKRATGFIVNHLDILDDVYSLSLVAYALQLAKDSNKDKILRDLNAKVITESGRRHWSTRKPSADETKYHPSSIDTEITGYALLANFHADRTDDVVPILKWLLSQRNERGGFVSTQDTIVGLQAITTIAKQVTGSATGNAIGIDLSSDGNSKQSFEVNAGNAQVLQQIQMPSQARKINVKAHGTGFTLASLSYRYYINESAAAPRFTIETTVKPTEYPSFLEFDVCVAFIPKTADGAANDESTESNMAVMEIDLPSGYQFDADQRQALQWTQSVKKVETRNDDTQIVLYFERLTTVKICPQVKAIRTHKVAHQKPAAIVVYDYYDTTRKSRVFYATDEKSLCDICETDCPNKCNL